MAEFKNYAQHNVLSVTGRVAAADIRTGKNGEKFLSVAVISNAEDEDTGFEIQFTTTSGLMSFVDKGYALKGRILTVTGHMTVPQGYYENAAGELQVLTRPRIKLLNAVVLTGGLGPAPKGAKAAAAPKGAVLKPAAAKAEADKRNAEDAAKAEALLERIGDKG